MVLLTCLAAMGLAVSPPATSTALAADLCTGSDNPIGRCFALFAPSTNSGGHKVLDVSGRSTSRLAKIQTYTLQASDPQLWALSARAADGSFTIRNKNSGMCLDATLNSSPGSGVVSSGLFQEDCNESASQYWYVQPAGKSFGSPEPTGSAYVLRHAADNKCMDVRGGTANDGTDVILYDCWGYSNDAAKGQVWWVLDYFGGTSFKWADVSSQMAKLAIAYGLKQVSDNSPVIKSKKFAITSDSPAFRGNYDNLTPAYLYNSTGIQQRYTKTLTHTTSWTNKIEVGSEFSVTTKVGEGPIGVEIKAAISLKYGHEWSASDSVTDTYNIDVPANSTGWIVRSQLYKTVTGNWTLTDDRGWTFSGTGSATVTAQDGQPEANSMSSVVVYCHDRSVNQVCMRSAPAAPNSIHVESNDAFARVALAGAGDDYGRVWTGSGTRGDWETFKFEWQSDGTVAIKSTASGKYVSAELAWTGDKYGYLRARATAVGPWEKFKLRQQGDGVTAVMWSNANGKYVWVDYAHGSTLRASRGTIGTDKHAVFTISNQ
ncbi:RICIN domain-containing protein [Streptomyces sp. NPDC002659]|uniref:RICIN domain-containing protein n=1 Tax=Streptomyces sp. NPDC002659 TaxID=3364656 RepID=UPI003680EEEA